ncbi:MAG TPA: hypothetical protein PLT66_04075, partial [Bacillota bacterium]|nr:hypothetical protein [Bacillota bacterium]
PFTNDGRRVGYINAYNPGVRENGGQYTHAAAQYLIALWQCGMKEKAFEILSVLNPAVRCKDKELAERYKAEPYALCGDICSNPEMPGRGGWALYTGSSAWYWCAIDEIFGL